MLKKVEKKHIFIKIIALAIIGFFIAMAFIEPKANIQPIEKQIDKPLN